MLPSHGANPHHVYEALGLDIPERIIDFSENVNHLPFPLELSMETFMPYITAYPDPNGEPFLSAVAHYHGVDKRHILLGNGAAEIFALLGNLLHGKRVTIIHPTFSEYEATLAPHDVTFDRLIVEDIATYRLPMTAIEKSLKQSAAIYICTPNNPTGVLPPQHELLQIIEWAAQTNTLVVLDEAFIDFIGEHVALIERAPTWPHVIVVRSMTKMYKMPGVRLGYAVAHEAIIAKLRAFTAHWHINGIASALGKEMLELQAYRAQTIDALRAPRETFLTFLQENGYKYTHSQTNYVSFQLPDRSLSDAFYTFMLHRGCVLRHTKNFLGMDGSWFRVGIKERAKMDVLKEGMIAWHKHRLFL